MICTKTACNRYAQVAAAALVRHTGRTTSTSDQCYLACHLARVVFISSMPRERNARSPYQKSPKPKAYPRPRIRLHAPTTRQARLLYPLKSYRLAPLLAKIINPSLIQSHRPARHLQHPSTARQQAQKRVFMEKEYDNHLLTLMLHQLRVAPAVQLGCDCVEDPARHRLILCYCLLN